MNTYTQRKELSAIRYLLYLLLSFACLIGIVAMLIITLLVYWQATYGSSLPDKYTNYLEIPSYIFIVVGTLLSLRRFTVKKPLWEHTQADISQFTQYIRRKTSQFGPVLFFRAHPLFGYSCLIGGISLVLNTLWRMFLPTTNNENYITLFIPSLIGRKSSNVHVKKASRIIMIVWFACIATLIYDTYFSKPDQYKESVKENVQNTTKKNIDSSSKIESISIFPTPTINPNGLIDCMINERCGGGTKKLTYDQCKETICCGVGETWVFLPHLEQCKKAQMTYHGLTDEGNKK